MASQYCLLAQIASMLLPQCSYFLPEKLEVNGNSKIIGRPVIRDMKAPNNDVADPFIVVFRSIYASIHCATVLWPISLDRITRPETAINNGILE